MNRESLEQFELMLVIFKTMTALNIYGMFFSTSIVLNHYMLFPLIFACMVQSSQTFGFEELIEGFY